MLGNFDPGLFVNDLTNCKTTYCSQLLLSALMYWDFVCVLEHADELIYLPDIKIPADV
jgi:hypothetical protein